MGIFDIEYPKNYKGFVITPKNVDDGPRYFRQIQAVFESWDFFPSLFPAKHHQTKSRKNRRA
ncbi:hypothetical protein FC43_GL001804 [Limosilactobacillus ingluviei DSM 15946]|uniref:Uncharacterized protein n=1 Tax=Limosilactobacillus ingluviei DSM 15946 TaxID=1423760 RepID=A0A0R1UDL4_9LACO|nr:hypothetical protein FC43_GL001804 [Limosilactobacillus ingluviei DSM 15946]